MRILTMAGLVALLVPVAAHAEDPFTGTLTIANHKFEPAELHVPAGRRILLKVVNKDGSAEEFESHSLKVEKVIGANAEATVRIGALKPGRYEFVGEYHEATAKGTLIAE